jgi:hypothetical protein
MRALRQRSAVAVATALVVLAAVAGPVHAAGAPWLTASPTSSPIPVAAGESATVTASGPAGIVERPRRHPCQQPTVRYRQRPGKHAAARRVCTVEVAYLDRPRRPTKGGVDRYQREAGQGFRHPSLRSRGDVRRCMRRPWWLGRLWRDDHRDRCVVHGRRPVRLGIESRHRGVQRRLRGPEPRVLRPRIRGDGRLPGNESDGWTAMRLRRRLTRSASRSPRERVE